ncbi:serine/threonine-protein kinase [Allocatelliglobosispora scoriae]|uniref:Serine/threonine-protein kinase n=1 Tax=Allocatelliglobosispora scoriae TaxID=643052 RepID=A0A841BPJ7_9ACTN|nr:hypothetical protein [Allocatelliglobosispora scoriae]MBB5869605.1 serine/threonine-protein kinase [Allocatelliglobosispora scoriae]
MKRNTPLITLLVGAAIAVGLIAASSIATAQDFQRQAGADGDPVVVATTQAAPTAAASSAAPAPATVNAVWAGSTNGGAASIAISVKDGVAVAYLCDGRRAEAWLQGTAADGKLALTGAKGAALTGTFGGGKATGTVTAAGRTFTFTAPAVSKPSGLYRAVAQVRNAKVVGGWIVLPDGSQVGVVTTDGEPAPAPPIDPATGAVTVGGEPITAAPVDGSLTAN